jgi:hypothetical protein
VIVLLLVLYKYILEIDFDANSHEYSTTNSSSPYTTANMRLTYTPDPPIFSNPSEQAFLKKLIKDRGHLGLGPLYRTLLISPTFARGFLQFFTAIRLSRAADRQVSLIVEALLIAVYLGNERLLIDTTECDR